MRCLASILAVCLVFWVAATPSSATTWVERRLPTEVSQVEKERVATAAAQLRFTLDACAAACRSLPDEPGEESHRVLAQLEAGWWAYVVAMQRWGCIDEERLWMKPLPWVYQGIWGREYAIAGLPVADECTHTAPQLLSALITTMRAELEGSQQEHLDYIRRLEEPPPWEEEPPPYELPVMPQK